MLKGVTKNVIEINLDNEYFERALVVLKDDCSADGEALNRQARLMLKRPPAFIKGIRARIRIKMAICAISGALSAILLCVGYLCLTR